MLPDDGAALIRGKGHVADAAVGLDAVSAEYRPAHKRDRKHSRARFSMHDCEGRTAQYSSVEAPKRASGTGGALLIARQIGDDRCAQFADHTTSDPQDGILRFSRVIPVRSLEPFGICK
jgi:hypothetical protein